VWYPQCHCLVYTVCIIKRVWVFTSLVTSSSLTTQLTTLLLSIDGTDGQTDRVTDSHSSANRENLAKISPVSFGIIGLTEIVFAARSYTSAVYAVVFVRRSVRPSVPDSLSVTSRYCIETIGRIELVFGWKLPVIYTTLCYKEICLSREIRLLSSGTRRSTDTQTLLRILSWASAHRGKWGQLTPWKN